MGTSHGGPCILPTTEDVSPTHSTRPFRFGLTDVTPTSPRDLQEFARRAESLGYSCLSVGDHHHDWLLSPLIAQTWVAAATTSLRVGTYVLDNDFRHPAQLAKEVATLDYLSGGRVELGIGAGWLRADYDAMGISYDAPSVRVDRLAEALAIITAAWRCEGFDFDGEHYKISNYRGSPPPHQSPRPPLFVCGGRPKILRLAGRHADIVGINATLHRGEVTEDCILDSSHSRTLQKLDWIRQGAGNRFPQLELQLSCWEAAVTDDPAASAAFIADKYGVPAEDCLASDAVLIGAVTQLCDELHRRRAEYGVTYTILPAEAIDDFAPVVARLAGT